MERETAVADTAPMTTDEKLRPSNLPRISSSANSAPAIGALKVAAIAPAAATAARLRRRSSLRRNHDENSDAIDGAHLHHRTLRSERCPRPHRQRGRERSPEQQPPRDPPPQVRDRHHHVRHAGPARVRAPSARRWAPRAARPRPASGPSAARSGPGRGGRAPSWTSSPTPWTRRSKPTAARPASDPTTMALATSESVSDDAPLSDVAPEPAHHAGGAPEPGPRGARLRPPPLSLPARAAGGRASCGRPPCR